jgi:hypothetical protein
MVVKVVVIEAVVIEVVVIEVVKVEDIVVFLVAMNIKNYLEDNANNKAEKAEEVLCAAAIKSKFKNKSI